MGLFSRIFGNRNGASREQSVPQPEPVLPPVPAEAANEPAQAGAPAPIALVRPAAERRRELLRGFKELHERAESAGDYQKLTRMLRDLAEISPSRWALRGELRKDDALLARHLCRENLGAIAADPSGTRIAIGTSSRGVNLPRDPTFPIQLLDLAAADQRVMPSIARARFHDGSNGISAAYSPDGRHAAIGALQRLVLFRISSQSPDLAQRCELPAELGGYPRFSPDGKLLAFVQSSQDGPRLKILRLDEPGPDGTPVAIADRALTGPCRALAFSPDSERIALGLQGQAIAILPVQDADSAEALAIPTVSDAQWLEFLPSGEGLIHAHFYGLEILDCRPERASESRVFSRISSPGRSISSLALSPDGATFALGFYDAIVEIYSLADLGQEGAPLRLSSHNLRDPAVDTRSALVAFLDGGRKIAAGGYTFTQDAALELSIYGSDA